MACLDGWLVIYMYFICAYDYEHLHVVSVVFTIFILCFFPLPVQYVYAQPPQAAVVEGIFVPWCQNCSSGAVEQGLGIVGAVIMPHNLYLHSGLVLVSFSFRPS